MDSRQAFALGLAAASEEFRKQLIEKVVPEAFDIGPPRALFDAMVANDAKSIIKALTEMGIGLAYGEKVKPYLLRTLADEGKKELLDGERNKEHVRQSLAKYGMADSAEAKLERIESLLCRARIAKTFGGPEAAVRIMRQGIEQWDKKGNVP